MRLIASVSAGDTAGRPASIRWMPASDSASAIRSLSSAVNSTPACCSPSRSVTSWISTFSGIRNPSVTSGRKFHSLVNH